MIIALCGSSGSGKSTLIKMLLKSKYFERKKIIYKGEDDFFFITLLKKIFHVGEYFENNKKEILSANIPDKENKIFRSLVTVFYPIMIYFEFLYYHIKYELIFNDVVFIKDRYIQDYIVTFKCNMGIKNRFIYYLFSKFPKPYLSFVIDVSRDTAIERNRLNQVWMNHSGKREQFHKYILDEYRRISEKRKLFLLDNNGNIENAFSEIQKIITLKEKFNSIRKIAIIGIDGTGKSTIANMLNEYLSRCNIKSVVAHSYHNPILYRMLLWFKIMKKQEDSEENFARNREISKKRNLQKKSFLWAFLHYFDAYIQYFIVKAYYRRHVIIFDRFFDDYIINFKFYRVNNYKVFKRFIPEVDKKFALVCDPEISYSRKPENTLEFFIDNAKEYERLTAYNDIVTINTSNMDTDNTFKFFLEELSNVKKKIDTSLVNNCILSVRDIGIAFNKNKSFYEYLMDNNIAYFYAQNISTQKNAVEEEIKNVGVLFNSKYIKTMTLIKEECDKLNIDFLLFKTHKYIPEAVDNDIDIILKNKQNFYAFMDLMKQNGFSCHEDEYLKGRCEKKGYCKIEPRTNISFHDIVFMAENDIWNFTETININGMDILKTSKEIDVSVQMLNVIYGPNYLKLYLYVVLQDVDFKDILSLPYPSYIKTDLKMLMEEINKINIANTKFPFFLKNISFVQFYFKRIFFNKGIKKIDKLRHCVFFFYIKYKYIFFKKLHFKKEWINI